MAEFCRATTLVQPVFTSYKTDAGMPDQSWQLHHDNNHPPTALEQPYVRARRRRHARWSLALPSPRIAPVTLEGAPPQHVGPPHPTRGAFRPALGSI